MSASAREAARNWPCVFVLGGGRRPRRPRKGARRAALDRGRAAVQAVLKRQAGVPFAPKDLRSSFTTFLLSDANSRTSALKKAVAHAMRHSTAQQGSAAYEKGRAERTRAAEVQVAGAFAAHFA